MTLEEKLAKISGKSRRQAKSRKYYRHSLPVRLTHWVNLVCMVIMLMSGLAIFNGWPALYWGIRTHFDHPLLAMYAKPNLFGHGVGITYVLGHRFETTGWLGLSAGAGGVPAVRGFPAWATLPGTLNLALARRWHLFFAWVFVINGLVYVAYALISRHFRRDLLPSPNDLRHIFLSILNHARLRFPKGEAALRYNVLQRITYIVVAFGMGPLMVLSGLTMSPWLDAAFPFLPALFGGRQSARTIHFLTAFGFVGFVLIHILMVLLSGAWNHMRAMVTGWYRIGVADNPGETSHGKD